LGDDDLSGFQDGYDDRPVPELPEDLAWADARVAAAYEAGTWTPSTEPPCGCACCADPMLSPLTKRGVPQSLAEAFEDRFRVAQEAQAGLWRAAVAVHDAVLAARGPSAAVHVGAELAVRMRVHPRTGMGVMVTAIRAVTDVPRLVELVQHGYLSDRHVKALLDEVGKWTDDDAQARLVLDKTLDRCAERAARCGWPTPGELVKILQRVAILQDLRAAEKRRKSVAERRGVSLWQTGAGAAALTIEGPDAQVALMHRAIVERAEAMRHLEGDTRSKEQREYDAASELLTIDADMPPGGGLSARPTTGLDGEPLELGVRGAHVALVMPYSVADGGELELAEIPGLGYVLPSTARELVEHADRITRVAVDADTGDVLAVDDAVPGPNRIRAKRQPQEQHPTPVPSKHRDATPASSGDVEPTDPDDDPDDEPGEWPGDGPDDGPDDGPGPRTPAPLAHDDTTHHDTTELDPARSCERLEATRAAIRATFEALRDLPPEPPPPDLGYDPSQVTLSPDTLAQLRELATRKVIWRDLSTSAYRVPNRLRRYLEHRDRTCRFPGCTVPGRYCDADHRDEFPRGHTDPDNCHLLCRRHHRAKQFYFAQVTLDPATGDTCWTTYEGTTYRRPPPCW
jgi:hypothetical protein